MLLADPPMRKNKTPFTGCKVLDGTTTDNDWEGFLPLSYIPYVVNPKKGFIVTANNRQFPDTVAHDLGLTQVSTARSQRIHELIS